MLYKLLDRCQKKKIVPVKQYKRTNTDSVTCFISCSIGAKKKESASTSKAVLNPAKREARGRGGRWKGREEARGERDIQLLNGLRELQGDHIRGHAEGRQEVLEHLHQRHRVLVHRDEPAARREPNNRAYVQVHLAPARLRLLLHAPVHQLRELQHAHAAPQVSVFVRLYYESKQSGYLEDALVRGADRRVRRHRRLDHKVVELRVVTADDDLAVASDVELRHFNVRQHAVYLDMLRWHWLLDVEILARHLHLCALGLSQRLAEILELPRPRGARELPPDRHLPLAQQQVQVLDRAPRLCRRTLGLEVRCY